MILKIIGILIALFLLILLIFIILNIISKWTDKTTATDLVEDIEKIIDDTISRDDFDEFECCPIRDPALDKIRRLCIELLVKYPPKKSMEFINSDGKKELLKIVSELKKNVSIERASENKN